MTKFKEWCRAERIGRAEEGTSQDMLPTNGDVLRASLIWGGLWILIGGAVILNITIK